MHAPLPPDNEKLRLKLFGAYWKNDLNDVFADVAPYYDRANVVASLGLWSWFLAAQKAPNFLLRLWPRPIFTRCLVAICRTRIDLRKRFR